MSGDEYGQDPASAAMDMVASDMAQLREDLERTQMIIMAKDLTLSPYDTAFVDAAAAEATRRATLEYTKRNINEAKRVEVDGLRANDNNPPKGPPDAA